MTDSIPSIPGYAAVQVFFIISGFYISLILNEKYVGPNSGYFLYFSNRLLRLFPLYWLLMIMYCIVRIGIGGPESFLKNLPGSELFHMSVPAGILFSLSHLFLVGQDLICFIGIDTLTGKLFFTSDFMSTKPVIHQMMFDPPSWSLSFELFFYALAPFVLKKPAKTIVLLMIISIVIRIYLYNFFQLPDVPWSNRFFPSELLFFLMGNISYRIYNKLKYKSVSKLLCSLCLVFALLFTLLYSTLPKAGVPFLPFNFVQLVYYILIMLAIPFIFLRTQKSKIDRFLGELSYPIYISHWVFIFFVNSFAPKTENLNESVLFWTISFSIFISLFFQKPLDAWRTRRLQKPTAI